MIPLPIATGQPLVLFTDLDGTLIDHHTYSTESARSTLELLASRHVPVVFCSSKTFAEQQYLQRQLGLSQPFILENGSAVAVPKGYFSTWPSAPLPDTTRSEHCDLFVFAHAASDAIRTELTRFPDIRGYFNASDAELTSATGLYGEDLERARDRWYTETLITPLSAVEAKVLQRAMSPKGWLLSKGGRFFTAQSAQVDKGKAVHWLQEVFRKNMPEAPIFAAIGDSPNDATMLDVVDIPFLVQRYDGRWADLHSDRLIKIRGIGPAGFQMAIQMLLG